MFKWNNLGLALGMALKFHTIVAKGFKLQVRKSCMLIPTFVEVAREKLVGGELFALNRVKTLTQKWKCLEMSF